ncbi:hypothetical protein [Arthrobacter sp. MW3 TE3886]|uniref:hypothetical protein n=1 Tax=Arthrobacter sp. MW3 TE3886 TaxID=3156254 RepID=UPI0035122667
MPEVGLESQVLSGDRTDENVIALLSTSGLILQPIATDALTTAGKAMTVNAEALDPPRDSGATGKYLLGDPAGDGVE